MAICAAAATSLIIIVNAVFLQSGSRPAPYFVNPRPQPQLAVYNPPAPVTAAQPVAVRRNDPIAELIGPSPRIAAVQRALSDYGYGQIKPTGMLDDATSNAIEKFEREHKLPVSGRVSDRLVSELTGLVGHPIE
jgi:peptidoglycan hydrolase-like protein with peptidoglycan-binding domain